MMNSQEMETRPLKLNLVVRPKTAYGMIRWKQAVTLPTWALWQSGFRQIRRDYGARGSAHADGLILTLPHSRRRRIWSSFPSTIREQAVLVDELRARAGRRRRANSRSIRISNAAAASEYECRAIRPKGKDETILTCFAGLSLVEGRRGRQPQRLRHQRPVTPSSFGLTHPTRDGRGTTNSRAPEPATTYVEFSDDEGCVWNIHDWANHTDRSGRTSICKFNVLRLRYDPGTKTTSFLAE